MRMKTSAVQTGPVFVYGTLMNPAVLQTLLGRDLSLTEDVKIGKARLQGFQRHPVKGEVFPAMIHSSLPLPSSEVQGLLLPSLSPMEISLLDWFESVEYDRRTVQVFRLITTEGAEIPIDAQAYIWREDLISRLDLSKEWSYQNFCDNDLEWYLRASVRPCREEMVRLGMTPKI